MPHTTDGFNSFHGSKAQVEDFLRRMNATHAHDAGARPEPSAETPVGALEPKGSPKVGDLDGSGVYVGKSATDGKDLHAALADEPGNLNKRREKSMSGERSEQDVQVSVGKDFVIMGCDRVEVSADGKIVTAYTKDGVETKAASGAATREGAISEEVVPRSRDGNIHISADFKTVVLNGAVIERAVDGHLVISSPGTVITKPGPANESASKASHEIGAIETTGEHKGEIYGGIYPADNKPIWFSAAPKLMDHYAAAAWTKEQGGSLPTRKQGDYLTTLKGKGGAFTEIFNRGGSFPAGFVWLAEPYDDNRYDASWCQQLSDGDQHYGYGRIGELPVLCVRR